MTTKREFHGVSIPRSCARVTASGVPKSADLTTPRQVKGCCGKEVVAGKRQLGKKEQEQHSSTLAPCFDPCLESQKLRLAASLWYYYAVSHRLRTLFALCMKKQNSPEIMLVVAKPTIIYGDTGCNFLLCQCNANSPGDYCPGENFLWKYEHPSA